MSFHHPDQRQLADRLMTPEHFDGTVQIPHHLYNADPTAHRGN